MKPVRYCFLVTLLAWSELAHAQFGGGASLSDAAAKTRAEQNERQKRELTQYQLPPTGTSMFVDASVLMNVQANEFVATFGIVQEGSTIEECSRKMDTTVKEFTDALKAIGIADDAWFLDYVMQSKTYGFDVQGSLAREKLVGFELKKNLSIHFKDKSTLEKLVFAAARSEVYDLIKVDYVVPDAQAVQERLFEEAARVIKQKADRYERLLGIKLQQPGQVYAERASVYYPSEQYDSYTAAESEQIQVPFGREGLTIQHARKNRTLFFNGLDGDGFDRVVNPVIIEPVVQFTLYLKLRYDIGK